MLFPKRYTYLALPFASICISVPRFGLKPQWFDPSTDPSLYSHAYNSLAKIATFLWEDICHSLNEFLVYFQKDGPLTNNFKWTDDKFISLSKCWQEFKSSVEFRNCDSKAGKVKLHFFSQTKHYFKSASVLFNFLINWASNFASVLLITCRYVLTETCYILFIYIHVHIKLY